MRELERCIVEHIMEKNLNFFPDQCFQAILKVVDEIFTGI